MDKGFVALSSVLVISAVVLGIVATIAYLSIGEAQSTLALFKGEDNLTFVEGCAENVLQGIHDSGSYSATSLVLPEGTCTISYTQGGPTNWDITISSPAEHQRKVRLVFTRGTSIVLTSWQEI